MKKKALSLVLMAILLASCGGTGTSTTSDGTSENSSATSGVSSSLPDSSMSSMSSSDSSSNSSSSSSSSSTTSVAQEVVVAIDGEKEISLVYAQSVQLTVSVLNATDTSVVWKSSDEKVATVDKNGLVTSVNTEGTAVITATSVEDPTKSDSITLTAVAPALPTEDTISAKDNYTAEIYYGSTSGLAMVTTKVTSNVVEYVELGAGYVFDENGMYEFASDVNGDYVYTSSDLALSSSDGSDEIKASLNMASTLTEDGAIALASYLSAPSFGIDGYEYQILSSGAATLASMIVGYFDVSTFISTVIVGVNGDAQGFLFYSSKESYYASSPAIIVSLTDVGETVGEPVTLTNFVESGEAGDGDGVNEDLVPETTEGGTTL